MELQFRPENAHVVTSGERTILVAAKSMSLFVLDPTSAAILRYAQTQPRLTLEQLTEEFAGRFSPPEVAETVQELMNLHVFTTAQPQPKPIVPVVDIEHFPLGSLVLNVANKCNLHCTYCYEPEAAKYGPSPMQMDWEMAQTSVDFLFHRAGKNREVNLIFFGGEALLNFKLMREVVAYAEEKGRGAGKKVDFSVTTNGTLLTDEIIDFFQEHRFGLTVSLDGPQDL